MRKYDSYKDSGIEWIGEIPSHWEVKKGKRFIPLKNGFPFDSSKFSPFSDSGLPLVRIRDIETSATETFYKGEAIEDAIIDNGDILIGMDGDFNIAIWNGGKALLNQRVCKVEKDKGFDEKFLYYLFPKYLKIINDLTYFTTVKHLSNNDLWQVKYPLPPKTEQTAIAAYLDRKTAEIDELIADKKRLLELYEEEKTAIINQAVTKGINPNAPMKDSGIEWLGDIPEHWEVKRFKYYFDLITEKVEEDLPKIGLENIESKSGKFIKTDSDFAGQGVRFRPNDILFGKLRPYLAKVWLSNFDGQAVGDFYVFRTKQEVYPEFAKYRILDSSFIEVTNSSTYGSKMPRVSWEFIADLPIAFPKYQEQKALVYHIETECALIDAKTKNTKKLIDLLTEYRTALISEVVTGKIKVTE